MVGRGIPSFLLANLCNRLRVRISFLISELNQGLLFNLILTNLEGIPSEFNLTNVIKKPTRNGALLDPILVSNLDIVIDSEVISINRDISDQS
jgi:hypothetical protein